MSARYKWNDTDPQIRLRAMVVSGGLTLVVLLLLLWLGFVTPLPLPGEEGIAVSFGSENGGRHASRPAVSQKRPTSTPQPPKPAPQPDRPRRTETLTQDFEDAPTIKVPKTPEQEPKKTPPQRKPEPARERKRETEKPEPKPEVKPEPVVDEQSLFPGQQASPSAGKGSGGEKGNQGQVDGKALEGGRGAGGSRGTGGTGKGVGPGGSGVSYSLGSRRALSLPSPAYPSQRSGKVVVKVWVDQNGKVTKAVAGQAGSTTFDQGLLRAAEQAALNSNFDVDKEAPSTQVGTIAYIFKLKQ